MNKKIFKKRGIILIEAIIAMAVIVIVMTALITALVSAMNSTRFSEDQTIATGYAQEGMEIIRNQKNSNFSAFKDAVSGSSEYDLGPGSTKIPGTLGLIDDKFERIIYADEDGRDRDNNLKCERNYDADSGILLTSIYVASIVSWNSSKCDGGGRCHEVVLESCITNLSYMDTAN